MADFFYCNFLGGARSLKGRAVKVVSGFSLPVFITVIPSKKPWLQFDIFIVCHSFTPPCIIPINLDYYFRSV